MEPIASTLAFMVGLVLYASTAFAWVFVMKHLKLATISVIYSISMILLLGPACLLQVVVSNNANGTHDHGNQNRHVSWAHGLPLA